MNCVEFNRLFAELDDQTALPAEMQEHRRGCRSCGEMVDDIIYLARQARVLRPQEAPGDGVWRGIQNALGREGLIRAAGSPVASEMDRDGVRPVAYRALPRRAPMGLAYASMFALALSVMYFHSLFSGGGRPPMLVSRPQLPSIPMINAVTVAPGADGRAADGSAVSASEADGAAAELAWISPTEARIAEADIDQLATRVPEEHRATMVSTWNNEVSTYRNLSDFIDLHPEDPFVRGQLMNSEQRLELIMERFSRWNEPF